MSFSKIIGCGMLFAMCLISASMAKAELQDMQPHNDQEALLKNVQELLRSIQSMLDPGSKTVSENAKSNWTCAGLRCQRCQRVGFSKINFDKNCCVTIEYLRSSGGLNASVKCEEIKFWKEASLSVLKPPPICIGIPLIKRGASICLQLDKVHRHGQSAHGDASLIGLRSSVNVGQVNLGSFDIYDIRQASQSKSALEPPSYDTSNWIGTQQDTAAMPDFDDDKVMMENIGQPL